MKDLIPENNLIAVPTPDGTVKSEPPANTKSAVDMSSAAIERRLRLVAELYTLGMAIKSGRFVDSESGPQ